MSERLQAVTNTSGGVDYMLAADEHVAQTNPVMQMHSLLRGRYPIAVALALILGVLCGYVGYCIQKPDYVSTALIRIKPVVPKILFENDQNGMMPMFDAFVETQVALIQNERLLSLAMQDADWQTLKRGVDPDQVLAFQKSLNLSHGRGSEIIAVSFTDKDPGAAQMGAQAVSRAYDRLYGENDTDSLGSRMKVLEDRSAKLTNELKQWKDKVMAVTNEVGAGAGRETLDQMHRAKLDQLNQVEVQLRTSKIELAVALEEAAPASQPSPKELSAEVLAQQSPQLRSLYSERLDLERRINVDQLRLGSQHRTVIDEQLNLKVTEQQIKTLEEQARAQAVNQLANAGTLASGRSDKKSLPQLRAEVKNYQQLSDQLKQESLELSKRSVDAANLQSEADAAKARLDATNQRLEQLNLESSIGGRIIIESKGDRPLAPDKDKRKQFAAVGGLGGAGLGVGIVLLIGFLGRSVRHVEDVKDNAGRPSAVLGVLPYLPDDLHDSENALVAAHSVHQIRATLQHRQHQNPHPVFAITSSSPGAGKTSLTLALGLSFAASGARTLLIDCDIIGGGLTAKLKKVSRRRLGHILRRTGVITTEQINEALRKSSKSGNRFGESLVSLGYATDADIEHAIDVQQQSIVGLREAMDGDSAVECITGTGLAGLYMLPLGSAEQQHAGRLSYPVLHRILDQIRSKFDVILIDTGPVLGSLEASVAAMAADEVVLTVARGERRPLFNRAMEKLQSSGAKLAGIVLNRAATADLHLSGFSQSVNRHPVGGASEQKKTLVKTPSEDEFQFGPIAGAVASLTELPQSEKKS